MSRLKYGYKHTYSTDIIEHIRAGNSLEDFAKLKCVTVDSVYLWFEKYPEFYTSYKIATRDTIVH